VTTIQATSLTVNGAPLTAGTYSLYLRSDQIIDVDEGLPISPQGQIVVANAGSGNLSTATLTGSTLGALSQFGLPQTFNNFAPSSVVGGDVNQDGVGDLLVASSTQDSVSVFLGNPTGTFATTPDALLDLPAGSNASAMLLTDLNNDGKPDLVVAEKGLNGFSIFLNASSGPGDLTFGAANSGTLSNSNGPIAVVAGNFDGDKIPDLIFANSGLDAANNYTLSVLKGTGGGAFNGVAAIPVGNSTPTGLQAPSSLAVGSFNGDAIDDLVVGGSNGVSVLLAQGGGQPTFTANLIAGSPVLSVAAGPIRPAATATAQDFVATTTAGAGQLLTFLNTGTGTFTATGAIAAGVPSPSGLQLKYLNGNNLPALQTGTITTTVGSALSNIVVNSPNHGLQNGRTVTISGVTGHPEANGTFGKKKD
jgi:hypothetical protein